MCSFNSIWEDQQSAMRRGEHSSFGMHRGQALPEVVYRGPLPKGLGAVRYVASVTLKPPDDCLFAKSKPAANGSEARLAAFCSKDGGFLTERILRLVTVRLPVHLAGFAQL